MLIQACCVGAPRHRRTYRHGSLCTRCSTNWRSSQPGGSKKSFGHLSTAAHSRCGRATLRWVVAAVQVCAADSTTSILENIMSLGTIILIVLILMLIGAFPSWPHSASWGYGPSGGLGLIVIVLIVLLLMGKL